jgi:hypothetical protein
LDPFQTVSEKINFSRKKMDGFSDRKSKNEKWSEMDAEKFRPERKK